MLKIGVISDTHGSASAWARVINGVFRDVQLIIHAGDVLYHGPRNPLPEGYDPPGLAAALNSLQVPLVVSRGNCEAEVDQLMINWPLQAPYAFVQIESLRLLVHHGHNLNPEEQLAQAGRYGVDFFICGHTHIPVLKREKGVIILNPGSPSLPKNEGKIPTAALIEDGRVQLFNLTDGKVINELEYTP